MIDPIKLIGFVYDSHLEMPEKIRLSSLVIYGDEEMHKKVFFLVQKITDASDSEKKKKKIAHLRKELFRIAEETIRKIEAASVPTIESAFS